MDISVVPSEVLVGAIQKLEVVSFWGGKMTDEQLTAILIMVKEELGRIKRITIDWVFGMSSVSHSLLLEAKSNRALYWFECDYDDDDETDVDEDPGPMYR